MASLCESLLGKFRPVVYQSSQGIVLVALSTLIDADEQQLQILDRVHRQIEERVNF